MPRQVEKYKHPESTLERLRGPMSQVSYDALPDNVRAYWAMRVAAVNIEDALPRTYRDCILYLMYRYRVLLVQGRATSGMRPMFLVSGKGKDRRMYSFFPTPKRHPVLADAWEELTRSLRDNMRKPRLP